MANCRHGSVGFDIGIEESALSPPRCQKCEIYPECKECLKDRSNNYLYHFIDNSKGKCITENEIKDGQYYLDNKDNIYKKCPEGTIKVENNECIEENKIQIYIIIIIIFLIILILIALFCIYRKLSRKRRNNVLIEESKNMKEIFE